MYVIASETDVIRVRTNCAKYTVRLFPVQAEKNTDPNSLSRYAETRRQIGQRARILQHALEQLYDQHSLNTLGAFQKSPFPFWNFRYLFPETLDTIAYRLNIIDTHLSFEDAREHFDITEIAQESEDIENFSNVIREHLLLRPVD